MNPRVIALQGATNCRDLGDIRTADGRVIRRGLLFRSDSLAELIGDDFERLEALGLRTICDLRHESERIRKPNRLPADTQIRQHAIGFFPRGAKELIPSLGPHSDEMTVHSALAGYYRNFPLDHSSDYARMFEALLAPDAMPALIHCTSGKDRTGFGIALILMALGVSREDIVADYLLSNLAPRDLRYMVPKGVPDAALSALMKVRADYLEASFAAIDEHWSSEQDFLHDAVGLSERAIRRLRDLLLV
ncbi:tyrosine-protein phosphatase [Azoarcus sp. KH32C]|uniref:tyrosine-protein phosphatase n=1 Tax=Azoarcus sp. KH32C TaxID=748247 RepID=UPI0002385E33|nr:tyrosine-protein phosphatase [Azoarcus sp. KH32C]BAL27229.1 protein tyrosine/serine phosphatase [Azoarcus sp. KH32C]